MPHLHDFMGVAGPRKILTFVTGPFLKIIEWPWFSGYHCLFIAFDVSIRLTSYRKNENI